MIAPDSTATARPAGIYVAERNFRIAWANGIEPICGQEVVGRRFWEIDMETVESENIKTACALAALDGDDFTFKIRTGKGSRITLWQVAVQHLRTDPPMLLGLVEMAPNFCSLTEREREVLGLICADQSPDDIARILGIRRTTVHNHRANIKGKTGVRHDAGMVAWAAHAGMLATKGVFKSMKSPRLSGGELKSLAIQRIASLNGGRT